MSFSSLCLIFVSIIVGFVVGKFHERLYWNKLKRFAMAGQTVWIRGIGDVLVLGYSEDEYSIDYVKSDHLKDRRPDEIDPDELNSMTVSVPTNQFLAQFSFDDTVLRATKL